MIHTLIWNNLIWSRICYILDCVEFNIFKDTDLEELKLVTWSWRLIWKIKGKLDFDGVNFLTGISSNYYLPEKYTRIFMNNFCTTINLCFGSPWKWGTIILCTKKVGTQAPYLWGLLYLSYVLHPVLPVLWATRSWRIPITLWPIQAVLVDSSIRIGNLQNPEHTINTHRYNSSLSGPHSYLSMGGILYCR